MFTKDELLVIEDDKEINNLLCDILMQNKYYTRLAFTSMDGISREHIIIENKSSIMYNNN